MSYVADLHIHSRFSRACSQALNIPNLVEWAKYKGIDVLGTGDFLHPLWLTELKRDLKEDGFGFLSYSKDPNIKFVLTVEIASIYSHQGKGRRVHNIIILSSFKGAERLTKALRDKGAKLAADGRPIVGVSSKQLLQMSLEADEKALFIPAHAWTPWFGVFGSKSGYNSLEECFEDLTQYIYGIETGLSSDPAMNWRVKELDNRAIMSFSDAHSLPNLGRESTVFEGELTYDGLWRAIKQIATGPKDPRNDRVTGTLEFYPEEGKYHYTGHRSCHVKYSPEDTKEKGTICPVCGRGLTVGVMERVEEIAGRSVGELGEFREEGIIKSKNLSRPGYRKLVPLRQVIAEAKGTSPTSQKVLNEYKKLVTALSGEIAVLTKASIEDIAKTSGSKIAEGVRRVREGNLVIDPGYDGEYGVVKIWSESSGEGKEEVKEQPQLGLFD